MSDERWRVRTGVALATWWALGCTPATAPPAEPGGASTSASTDTASYTLGYYSWDTPFRGSKRLVSLLDRLEQRLPRGVSMRSAPTFELWTRSLETGQYDFALVSALVFVRLPGHEYTPVVQTKGGNDVSLFVERRTEVSSLANIAGRRVMSDPRTLPLLRAFLRDRGLDPDRDVDLQTSPSDVSCLQTMLVGDVDACAALDRAAYVYSQQMGVELRAVIALPAPVPMLWVVHRRVDAVDAATFREAFSDLPIDDPLSLPRNLRIATFEPFDPATLDRARTVLRRANPQQGTP